MPDAQIASIGIVWSVDLAAILYALSLQKDNIIVFT